MAIAPPVIRSVAPPQAFVEALNGLAVGIVDIEAVRRTIPAVLEAGDPAVIAARAFVADAFQEGLLGTADHDRLCIDLGMNIGGDEPTEWSDRGSSENEPTSDTGSPGEAGGDAIAAGEAGRVAWEIRPVSPAPGTTLRDRFVLQEKLATGGMGEIFRALDLRRQEAGAANPWVAIKLVSPANPRYTEALALLQQEAALARRLDHPYIVRVFDFDRDGDQAFVTMEWLDGESLAALLDSQRHRPLPPGQARQILNEAGDALQFAHGRGITHADVKPGNIFVTTDGSIRLLDFGIARASDTAHAAESQARTPGYASCEVLEHQPATPQDDVFSLACVAYRMFSGRRPFSFGDALAAERAGEQPQPIPWLGRAEWRALQHALAFRREARPRDVREFLRQFNAPDAEPAPAPTGPEPKPARLRPAFAVGAALFMAVAIFVLWQWRDGNFRENTLAVPPPVAGPSAPVPTRNR